MILCGGRGRYVGSGKSGRGGTPGGGRACHGFTSAASPWMRCAGVAPSGEQANERRVREELRSATAWSVAVTLAAQDPRLRGRGRTVIHRRAL